MKEQDHYAVLGVLPGAEDIVIIAAYRALAKRYHPDRWAGEPATAHRRMSEINVAYSVLGDSSLRAKYDKCFTKGGQSNFGVNENEDFSHAFDNAIAEAEDRWAVAQQIYPDLQLLRNRLGVISRPLEFSFLTILLESKAFTRRVEIAQRLEDSFLQRYFGSNVEVLNYAKKLIFSGQRPAAIALNCLLDVVGSDVAPNILIDHLESKFSLQNTWKKMELEKFRALNLERLWRELQSYVDYRSASNFAEALGYTVSEVSMGFFNSLEIKISQPGSEPHCFKNKLEFTYWAKDNLKIST